MCMPMVGVLTYAERAQAEELGKVSLGWGRCFQLCVMVGVACKLGKDAFQVNSNAL